MSLVPFLQFALVGAFRPNVAGISSRIKVRSGLRCISNFGGTPASPEVTKNRVYLSVPFDDKEEVKKRGARWDADAKKWYVGEFSPLKDFEQWQTMKDVQYLKVPFAEKDEVKALGARWENDKKLWYVPSSSASLFEKWIDRSGPPTANGNETFQSQLHAQETASELLFLKVDTSGLPIRAKFGFPAYTSLEDYNDARVVQVNALLCDRATFKELDSVSLIVRTDGFPISNANAKFHGVTEERSRAEGVDFAEAAHAIATILESRPLILAHNAEFDLNVLKSELFRHGLTEALEVVEETPALCTMQLTKSLLKIPDVNGNPKNPSIKELYGYAMIAESALEPGTRLGVKHLRQAVQKLVENDELAV